MGASSTQLIIVLVIVVLLFGSKKIPELAKGIGSGIRNFKKELNTDEEKENNKVVENKTETTQTSAKPEEKKEA
jgi:sec-independent protein translocase protein TatA